MEPVEVIDISQTLKSGMPVWPGDTDFQPHWVWEMSEGAACNVGSVHMSLHTGTHADAPRHFLPQGSSPADQPLEIFMGHARVIDVSARGRVDTAAIESLAADCPKRLLFKTGFGEPAEWAADFGYIEPDAAGKLSGRGTLLVGIDTPSVDPADSKSLATHHVLAAAGIAILENLMLTHVVPGDYELVALPLKLEAMDASPVRAVLRKLPRGFS